MATKNKKQITTKATVKKPALTHVMHFRVTEDRFHQLQKRMSTTGARGVRTANQYARKVVLDFVDDKLVYRNLEDVTNGNRVFDGR